MYFRTMTLTTKNSRTSIKPKALVMVMRALWSVGEICVRGADTVELYTGLLEAIAAEGEAIAVADVEAIAATDCLQRFRVRPVLFQRRGVCVTRSRCSNRRNW